MPLWWVRRQGMHPGRYRGRCVHACVCVPVCACVRACVCGEEQGLDGLR